MADTNLIPVFDLETGESYDLDASQSATLADTVVGRLGNTKPSFGERLRFGYEQGPLRFAEGGMQTIKQIAELAHLAPEGTADEFTAQRRAEQLAVAGGNPWLDQAANTGSQVTSLLLPMAGAGAGRVPGAATSLLDAARLGAVQGAAGAATTFDADGSPWGKVATIAGSGAAGGVLGAGMGLVPAVKNWIANKINNNVVTETSRTAAQVAASGDPALIKLSNGYTLGQATGNPEILAIEHRYGSSTLQNKYNQQARQVAGYAEKLAQDYEKRGRVNPADVASGVHKVARVKKAQMQDAASTAYRNGLDEVQRLAAQDRTQFQLPFSNVQGTLKRFVAENGSDWEKLLQPGGAKLVPAAEEALQILKAHETRNASLVAAGMPPEGLTVMDVAKLMQGASAMRRGLLQGSGDATSAQTANRLGRKLAQSIEADVDEFMSAQLPNILQGNMANVPVGTIKALAALQGTRGTYSAAAAAMRKMDQTVLMRVFGGKTPPASAEDALNRLNRSNVFEQKKAYDIIREIDPSMIDDMKAVAIRRAAEAGKDATKPAQEFVYNIDDFAKALEHQGGVIGQAGGLFTRDEVKQLTGTIAHIRTLMTGHARTVTGNKGVAGAPESLAATAAGGFSAPFTARLFFWLDELVGAKRLEKMLINPEAHEKLRKVVSTYKTAGPSTVAAFNWLQRWAQQDDLDTPPEPDQPEAPPPRVNSPITGRPMYSGPAPVQQDIPVFEAQ